ncbi:MAG: SLBB domain-containing protein [Prevotella sp.]
MKKLLIFFLLFGCSLASVYAQMSDEQVVDYVRRQVQQGKDQKQIAKELLSRGVSIKQLERLKSQYESQQKTQKSATGDLDRGRVNNGERRDTNTKNRRMAASSNSAYYIQDDFSGNDMYYDQRDIENEEDSIKIFGHDIFRTNNLTFESSMNVATPASYSLGPGDEVILDIYGASQLSETMKISPDGTITIPNEGPVHVASLTVAQAQAKVRRAIGGHYQDSNIKLTVGQTRTIIVNVMGEVKEPGTYTLSAFATVFNALYLAGGVNSIGTLREVKVSRNGRVITTVDIYDFILNGRLTGNVMLQDNDVIMVGPYVNLVQVEGKIKRPMYYEMKKNESLQSLLKFAGGFTGDAYKQKVRVERKSDDGLTVHNVDEWDFTTFTCEDGDVAIVSPIIERYKNTVTITGAVFREGQYKLGGNVNTVKTLIEQAGGLLEQAFSTRAVLHRMREDRTLNSMTINLRGILDGSSPDVVLQNEDELIISSTEEITSKRSLTIYGDVVMPGIYKYSDGETLEDLITEAGGLLESASLLNVEVARRIMSAEDNPDGKKMAKIYQATLAEGLAIEGETGLKLRPYDIVTIHRSPNYQEQRVVNISGEVLYGGSYVLSNKEERITDILKRAGGMTKNAYVDGVQLIRKVSKKELDIQRMKLEVAKNMADSLEIMASLQKTSYSVGIDLRKALNNPGSGNDIVMHEGDSIYIPQLNNVVKISGEVMFPNTIAYEKDRKASYYINQAGGLTKKAKRRLAYIVYPNGQVSRINKGKILPGCEVVVPTPPEKKLDANRTSLFMALASSVATIAAVLITALK